MIRVSLDESSLSESLRREYPTWPEDATEATRQAIEEWERTGRNLPKENSGQTVWAEFKRWLARNFFHGKCAYCEVSLDRHQADAEHFRPKGAVKYRNKEGKTQTAKVVLPDNGGEVDHPGYFWLAYDPFNLLPACSGCNSCDWEGNVGKRAEFPVLKGYALLVRLSSDELKSLKQRPHPSTRWPGYYYLRPLDLNAREDPGLIQPVLDDPQQHLRFGLKGVVVALTVHGEHTIRVFHLDDLNRDRESQQIKLKNQILAAWFEVHDPALLYDRSKPALDPFLSGDEPFAAAALDYRMQFFKFSPEFTVALEQERRRRAGV